MKLLITAIFSGFFIFFCSLLNTFSFLAPLKHITAENKCPKLCKNSAFPQISTPGNQVKLRYFSQFMVKIR